MSAMLKQKLIDIANGFTKYGLWKGGSKTLSELNDVTLTNLQKNDVLTYNGSEWVNDDNLQNQIDTLNSNLDETNTTLTKKSTVKRVTTSITSKIPGRAFATFTPGGAWDGFSYNSGNAVVSFVYGGAGGITILQIQNVLPTEITVTAYFWKYQIS